MSLAKELTCRSGPVFQQVQRESFQFREAPLGEAQ